MTMEPHRIQRHRTAIKRNGLSRPVRLAMEEGLINKDTRVFDYGCGRGGDVELLNALGAHCSGWDPVYSPNAERTVAEVVNLGYVVNVIEDPGERVSALRDAWSLAENLLIVSARLNTEANRTQHERYEDGYITRTGTFQKYFEQSELREWIDESLGMRSVAAAPGVFYVFRDEGMRQSFGASRYRRAVLIPKKKVGNRLFEEHQPLFEALMAFITLRGRLPERNELHAGDELRNIVGSLQRAFNIIRAVTGAEQWERIKEQRAQDLQIYLALARFGGRPRFSELPPEIQSDAKAFFSTYRRACDESDKLLFSAGNMGLINEACRTSPVGKLTQGALYVHVSALPYLSPILRIYEGCARAYIGAVEGANIVKLNRTAPQISYLYYPEFERAAHPALAASLLVPLKTFHIHYRDYADSNNPPVLHRKETFVHDSYPLRRKFERLTKQEERLGLYEKPEIIGTSEGWKRVLEEKGITISGHTAKKVKP
jgi:DNA phosphorothioation-associated putative methyltransferase